MRISSLISFIGFVLIIAGCYCRLLVFKVLVNWTHYDIFGLSKPYGMVVLLMAVIGIISIALDRRALVKLTAYVSLVLIALLFAGVLFQVKNTLNALPFNFLAQLLSKAIHFKWGWYVLFAGGILAVGGTFAGKPKAIKHHS